MSDLVLNTMEENEIFETKLTEFEEDNEYKRIIRRLVRISVHLNRFCLTFKARLKVYPSKGTNLIII